MGERRGAYRVLVASLEGKRPLGRPGRRWAKWILRKCDGAWTGLIWIRIETDGGHL